LKFQGTLNLNVVDAGEEIDVEESQLKALSSEKGLISLFSISSFVCLCLVIRFRGFVVYLFVWGVD